MKPLHIPEIKALDLRDQVTMLIHHRSMPGVYIWDWPRVPACAGRRDTVDFPPVVVKTGDSVKIKLDYGPFGFTARA